MRLTRKLPLSVVLVAIPAIMLLSFAALAMVRGLVQEPIKERQIGAANQVMHIIDRTLHERLNDIITIGQDTAVLDLIKHPHDTERIALADNRLDQLAVVTGPWDRLDVVDKNSLILGSVNDQLVGRLLALDAVQAGLQQEALAGKTVYSDVFLDPETDKPTMLFVTPVIARQGQPPIGLVVGHLSWQTILDILRTTGQEAVNLYNSKGVEIASKDDAAVPLQEDRSNNPAIKKAISGQDGTEILPGADSAAETLTTYVNEEGFQSFKGNGWVLTVETPTAEVFAPVSVAAWRILGIILLIIVPGCLLVILLMVRAVKPISGLTEAVNRLALGDLSKRIDVRSRDEVGQLGRAFNNMADKLQEMYLGLEAKVKQKTAELAQKVREVETERAKDEAILGSIGEGMIVVDPYGQVVKINRPAMAMLGVTEQLILGNRITKTIHVGDEQGKPLPDERRPGALALQHGQKTEDLYQIVRPDTMTSLVSIIASPIVLQQTTLGAIMIMRDVTKEKEVDRMKTEFISLASHQLRTPLSAIKWFAEMLVNGDAGALTDEQTEFAKNIAESTERMIDLVNSLLNISRIESGRIIVDPKPTDLQELVTGIINDLKAKTEQKQQNLIISVHKDLGKINLDPHLIGQVYLNFLTNAIKYTPKGGEISVFISRKADQVVSQITDNGYGIPKAEQARMFQKFFRASNVSKVETDGTGLGMYLVKAIVESSGGKLWFESQEGKGTTFWFSLPMSGMKPKAGEVTLDV